MGEEIEEQDPAPTPAPTPAPNLPEKAPAQADADGISISSGFNVEDAQELSPKGRGIILRAAAKIAEADKLAADEAAADKLAEEQRAQSREGRKERQAAVAAKQ